MVCDLFGTKPFWTNAGLLLEWTLGNKFEYVSLLIGGNFVMATICYEARQLLLIRHIPAIQPDQFHSPFIYDILKFRK